MLSCMKTLKSSPKCEVPANKETAVLWFRLFTMTSCKQKEKFLKLKTQMGLKIG